MITMPTTVAPARKRFPPLPSRRARPRFPSPAAWFQLELPLTGGIRHDDGMALRDADGDGQDNSFEYVAGLVPTQNDSQFRLEISRTNDGANTTVSFFPRFPDREYELLGATNLTGSSWSPILGGATNDAGTVRTVSDPDGVNSNKTYRIRITLP